ncbi:unnamed protein product [Mytilus edulis]|uniref:Uncharacterized protein n=1 Tax=Mytilus edulis TaxID=6550 RepID=A0A8S3T4Z1_MYTED|nr:unnamed protein product [Mytilus edulis]
MEEYDTDFAQPGISVDINRNEDEDVIVKCTDDIEEKLTIRNPVATLEYNITKEDDLPVEDIESHGPLLAYTEDGFEKTHGRIRGQIFQQNQHARSRDTAHSFMEMEVLNHIISGGYFLNKEEEWVQASSDVRKLSTTKEIKSFLGQKTDGAELLTANLIKAERSPNRKVVKRDITDEIKNAALLYTTETGLIMTSYHGIKCQNGEVINQGNPVYCQDEHDSAKVYKNKID